MKRILRWLLGPVVRWVATGDGECDFQYVGTSDGYCCFRFADVFGASYEWLWTPDRTREVAWRMIASADEAEVLAEVE